MSEIGNKAKDFFSENAERIKSAAKEAEKAITEASKDAAGLLKKGKNWLDRIFKSVP